MLRAKNLHDTLRCALDGGVESVLLLTTSGGLLGAAHVDPEYPRTKEHALLISVCVNLWRNYTANDLADRKPEKLEFLLVEVDQKHLCLLGTGPTSVLCLVAESRMELGMLRLRANSLAATLGPQLKTVLEAPDAIAI